MKVQPHRKMDYNKLVMTCKDVCCRHLVLKKIDYYCENISDCYLLLLDASKAFEYEYGITSHILRDRKMCPTVATSVYSPFSNSVGLPLHRMPSPGVLLKSIGADFYDHMLFLTSTTCVG